MFLGLVPSPGDPAAIASSGVLSRIVGPASKKFHFRSLAGEGDHCTVEAKGGEVDIVGTSAVAMCRGAYEYLKNQCHCQVSWSGDNVKLPATLPDVASFPVGTAYPYRHYFNVCTFGYTTVWWDWKRWQHEIDWMALHGINMPLAMNGQEIVWQKLFLSLGVPQASIDKFFTGPAFLPWHRMGNVDKHMGPLTANWIAGQARLQKKILGRERELGMKPVVPGFSGFVPADFQKFYPNVKLNSPSAWAGFDATKFLSPLDPLFVKIGTEFIKDYRQEFGSDHLYLCDTFNEMDPGFPADEESQDLKATGNAVFGSINAADPEGIWVTQGWLFYNERDYWTKKTRTADMLGAAPPGKLIVLDLASNEHEVWREQPAVKNGGWIYNTLHNYGQTTNLYGDLQHFVDVAQRAAHDPDHGRLLGMGLTPEGIDQNPVVYELMTDVMWHPELTDVRQWLRGYAASRYGADSETADQAWAQLTETLYSGGGYRDPWRYRPTLGVSAPGYDVDKVRKATELLLQSDGFKGNSLYRRDLVDVTKTWLGAIADTYLSVALASFDADKNLYRTYKAKYFDTLHDLDRIMATRPEHRLSTWIKDSRTWGTDDAEKARLEQNAKMQVTVWGGPELYDYANKEWAGLNQDFIRRRWELLFNALEKAGSADAFKAPDYGTWELNWAMSTTPVAESKPEDSVTLAKELLAKYKDVKIEPEKMLGLDDNPGIAVGKPVTDSGGVEGDHSSSFVTDGKVSGGYWSASPAPQWVQIDLQSVHSVNEVWLFPYYGDGRSYQYQIELSEDGKAWKKVVDRAANEKAATFRGYDESFSPVPARYVKVTMLHNSANIGVHLYEVRVFQPH